MLKVNIGYGVFFVSSKKLDAMRRVFLILSPRSQTTSFFVSQLA